MNNPTARPALDILRPWRLSLEAFFRPQSVAVIGATETPGSVGRTILWNLLSTPFGGTVFPVNPKRPSVLGLQAYPSLSAIPAAVDLAVIATPAASVPGIIAECAARDVKAAIIISAGFKEVGAAGAELERKIRDQLRGSSLRVVGPNCLGVMSPRTGLNATFAAGMALAGNVGFLSQSGALLAAILDWSLREKVGFSAFVSLGSMLDVGWGDLIDYLSDDPHTQSIVIYMESIGNARSFLSAAREASFRKPLIVVKAGRSEAAAKAAASHTGALAGSDDVLDAAFRRAGILRVNTIADVFYMASVLARQPRPGGPRLTIVTNAGGPGVLATDSLIANGGELATLSRETLDALNQVLPGPWSHNNPIDVLGDAGPERYAKAVEIAAADPNSDGLLVILTPQAMTDPTRTAEGLRPYAHGQAKPILASWMGGAGVAAGIEVLNQVGIPTFPYPDTAARAFTFMWRHSYARAALYETPHLAEEVSVGRPSGRDEARQIIDSVRRSDRTLLTELESKQLLAAYGIPTVPTVLAATEDEAVRQADKIGYPVVLKVHSELITHKTDVGGVQLNLGDAAAVREAFRRIASAVQAGAQTSEVLKTSEVCARRFGGVTVQPMIKLDGYELILGSSIDPQFGPVLLFGLGGQLVEVFRDKAVALPPLNTTLARRLMEQTKIYTALRGVRGRKPVNLERLEQLLVSFGQLVVEQPWIKEIDINPLLASPERLLALDARVILFPATTPESELPAPVIRPYPAQYEKPWRMKDGTSINIRPIRPEDEPAMVAFHETLSPSSVYSRYFQSLKLSQRVAHERLARLCFIDYDRELALVAEVPATVSGTPVKGREIIGVGRIIKEHAKSEAEFAVLVSDRFQGHGLGTELLRRLIDMARAEGLERLHGTILSESRSMLSVCEKLGFRLHDTDGHGPIVAELDLAVGIS
jgi:acetyltransferase